MTEVDHCAENARAERSVEDHRSRLIVNADDFGRSREINEAVLRAHRDGILTTASLMVNGDAFEEAVALARQHPSLGVGLHLTLVCGRAALPHRAIPGLVSEDGQFSDDPVRTGLRFFFQRSLRSSLRREMAAQVEKFRRTGLPLDHVNGHLNLHLHPTVFEILLRHAQEWGIDRVRLTRDPLRLNLRLAQGRWCYRLSHALIFGLLSRWAEPALARRNIRYTPRVFGLLQTGELDEGYLVKLLRHLPSGDSELYSHPSLHEFKHEMDALLSPAVRRLVQECQIKLIRYRDL
jgi:hopanoid biosynthesis associated protein HpnK